jgi:hypothetical protein
MQAHIALIGLLLMPAPLGHGSGKIMTIKESGWVLKVRSDPFSGRISCHLTKRNAVYLKHAIVFQLSRRLDTSDASYRIDDGRPILSRSDQLNLARLGFALQTDDLDNPSGGLVRIPEDRLAGASNIQIEPKSYSRPIKFKLEGFSKIMTKAQDAGCKPADFN